MENKEKRQLKDLFQDKTFLYSIPIFLILVGAFIWYVGNQSEPEPVAETSGSRMNTRIPTANTDSVDANKLEMQSNTLDVSEPSGFQNIPGSTGERLMYGNNRYRPSYSQIRGLDSVYQPTSGIKSSGIPSSITPTSRKTAAQPMFREDDYTIKDEPNESGADQAQRMAAQRVEMQNLLNKQKKLESMLTEYRRDKKEAQDKAADKTKIYKVLNQDGKTPMPITSLGGSALGSRNSFYGLYTEDARKVQQRLLDGEVGTIRAAVYGDQYITPTGSRIKLRLLEPLFVRGIIIPSNTILYGMGSFQGQRISISITSIQYDNRLFPVSISVYDMDGMLGLYVPGMPNQEIARQTASQAMNGMNGNLGGGIYMNGSAQAVAASAALQAGQQVYNGIRQGISQKIQTPRALLKNNYYVLMRQSEARTQEAKPDPTNPAENPFGESVGNKMQQLQQLQQILEQTQKNQ